MENSATYTYEELKEMSLEELRCVDSSEMDMHDRRTLSDLIRKKKADQREYEITEGILKTLKESKKLQELVDCFESGNGWIRLVNHDALATKSHMYLIIRVDALTNDYGRHTGEYKVTVSSDSDYPNNYFYERKNSILDRVNDIVKYVEKDFERFVEHVMYLGEQDKKENYAKEFVKEVTGGDYGSGSLNDVSVEGRHGNYITMKAGVNVTDDNREELKTLIREFSERVAKLKNK